MKKILLIVPEGYRTNWPKWMNRVVRFQNLTTAFLAALTSSDVEVEIIDTGVQKLDLSRKFDLVAGITTFTYSAWRVYEMCAEFRAMGIPTVLGGMHVSFEPMEAAQYADSVVIGEAEKSWPRILEDLKKGQLKKFYVSEPLSSLEGLPLPRRELLPSNILIPINVVQTARGCRNRCIWCQPAEFYGNMRQRPADDIIAEIAEIAKIPGILKRKFVVFADETFSMHKEVERIMDALGEHGIRWGAQMVTSAAARNPKLIERAADSGCFGIFFGIDSLSPESLRASGKGHNHVAEYGTAVDTVHANGIGVWGSFILGLKYDTPDIFETTVNFAIESGIELASFSPFTPLPGTRAFKEMDAKGTLLTKDWRLYDFKHVVYQPEGMTPEELLEGTRWCRRKFYAPTSIIKRAFNIQQKHLLWPTSAFLATREALLAAGYMKQAMLGRA